MLAFTPRPEGTHTEQGQMVPPSSPPAFATSLLQPARGGRRKASWFSVGGGRISTGGWGR
jgi:hypothetical protein